MKVEGERSFAAHRDTVWNVLNDPSSMAKLMPGVESFDVKDDRHWTANVKIPLGLGGLRMTVDMQKTEEREPEFARMAMKGNGVGAMMNMETAFHLSEQDEGTLMKWEADVKIAGPVGSMGQRVLQPIINQQVANVLNALDKQVQEAGAGATPSQPEAEVYVGATPGGSPEEGSAHGGAGDASGDSSGMTGTTPPSPATQAPPTEPDVKDYGPPADSTPEAESAEDRGGSAAEEGKSPWAPQSYEPEAPGPTTSTEGQ